jgi:hypothetical protein
MIFWLFAAWSVVGLPTREPNDGKEDPEAKDDASVFEALTVLAASAGVAMVFVVVAIAGAATVVVIPEPDPPPLELDPPHAYRMPTAATAPMAANIFFIMFSFHSARL